MKYYLIMTLINPTILKLLDGLLVLSELDSLCVKKKNSQHIKH